MELREAIRHLLEDPADVILANQILGTTDAEVIAARVEAHVGSVDDRARAARHILDEPAPVVPMHTDISCANVVVSGGRVAAIFDADSVCLTDEMRTLASAAVHYTYTGTSWTWPSRDQARAFVASYRTLDRAEWRRLDAAAIYALAYTARCEHSLGGGPLIEQLAAAPDAYLST
jgi:streptomycin 6-kinase